MQQSETASVIMTPSYIAQTVSECYRLASVSRPTFDIPPIGVVVTFLERQRAFYLTQLLFEKLEQNAIPEAKEQMCLSLEVPYFMLQTREGKLQICSELAQEIIEKGFFASEFAFKTDRYGMSPQCRLDLYCTVDQTL